MPGYYNWRNSRGQTNPNALPCQTPGCGHVQNAHRCTRTSPHRQPAGCKLCSCRAYCRPDRVGLNVR